MPDILRRSPLLGLIVLLIPLFAIALAHDAAADVFTLQNDGFLTGQTPGFQGGFVSGEIGAARLNPPGPFPMQLNEVLFLFGGASTTHQIVLRIYDDSGGTTNPGPQIFSGNYQVTGSDAAFQSIDLTGDNVMISGPIRVGIEMTHAGFPSIARDNDGITPSLNFIFAQGLGWVQSNLLGLTGDWIIRAVVETTGGSTFTVGGNVSGLNGSMTLQNNGGDDLVVNADGPFTFATALSDGAAYDVTVLTEPAGQNCVVTNGSGTITGSNVTDVSITCTDDPGGPEELKIDSFVSGQSAGFQGGFVTGEIGAVRLTPSATSQLLAVRFLFGGATGTRTIRLHIYDDSAGTDVPGAELFAQDYQVTAADDALQEIDLSGESIQVSDDFRVGIEFTHDGAPSIARDNDGIDITRNFVLATGLGWVKSNVLGVTGDWIIRAVVLAESSGDNEPEILAIDDVGNDQGRQVRIRFSASAEDRAGSGQPVVAYEAFRRIDPLSKRLDGWEFVGSVPAHGEAIYNMVAPTLADSTEVGGVHWSVFFVRAATAVPATFYDSPPDSGYSIDNLAPTAPQNLVFDGSQLDWDPAAEPDFAYYSVYASDESTLGPAAELLGHTTDPAYVPGGRTHLYFLVTTSDFSGNEGDAAAIRSAGTASKPVTARRLRASVHPNPFNPATNVSFSLPAPGEVTVRVYDLRGRQVDSLLEAASLPAGPHELAYRSTLPSGTYMLRVESGGEVATAKISIVR